MSLTYTAAKDSFPLTFHSRGREQRHLVIACGVCCLLGGASFALEWPLALAGGLLGTAFGLAAAARKEDSPGPLLTLSHEDLSYRGNIIARWTDVEQVYVSGRKDRRGRDRSVLTVLEVARGDAPKEIHRLDISELSEVDIESVANLVVSLRAHAQPGFVDDRPAHYDSNAEAAALA